MKVRGAEDVEDVGEVRDDLLTRQEAAQLLDVGIRTIDRWLAEGMISRYSPRPPVRGRRGTAWVRVSRRELLDLTRAREGE